LLTGLVWPLHGNRSAHARLFIRVFRLAQFLEPGRNRRDHGADPGQGDQGDHGREQHQPAWRRRGEQGGDPPGHRARTGVRPYPGAGEDGAEPPRRACFFQYS